eukprot:GCRY01002762.1.p1 GENE.GCRY01002762.1~~GCRY01002762.1.p1  ORF type:complete len:193 (+),score=32.38 GCRY01002762.1:293-871(+)
MDVVRRKAKVEKNTPLTKPLGKGKDEVSLSAFSHLFTAALHYIQEKSLTVADLESNLESLGAQIGRRLLDVIFQRERGFKRETRMLPMLMLVSSTIWKTLFDKNADQVEKSTSSEGEFMIIEEEPIEWRFVSLPEELGTFNVAHFTAGIIAGILETSGFPATVSAHFQEDFKSTTTFLIKFDQSVLDREARL